MTTQLFNRQVAETSPITWLSLLAYVFALATAVSGVLLVRTVGEKAATPSVPVNSLENAESASVGKVEVTLHVLSTLAAVMVTGYLFGKVFRYMEQPPVIGEVMAGICLGPSLLGVFSLDFMHLLIPDKDVDPTSQVAVALQMIAQLGILLYMFIVGLELNAESLKNRVPISLAISHSGIVFTFLLGVTLALWLAPRFKPEGVSFTNFSLFVGVAMSITAFPVLARILTDRGLNQTRLGTITLAAAAADDLTAWCLLALVIGIVQSSIESAIYVAAGSLLFVLVMYFVGRPLIRHWCLQFEDDSRPIPATAILLGLVGVLVAGLCTEVIGIHAIFGGFLLGAMVPHESRIAKEFEARLSDLVTTLMLPAFFALTGMRTQIGLVDSWEAWLFCGIIIAVATLGKFGGTFVAARVTGSDWREASALGVLMNTRGLMELIVLNLGLDLGLISPTLFSMMVIMALTTTIATSPALQLLTRQSARDECKVVHLEGYPVTTP